MPLQIRQDIAAVEADVTLVSEMIRALEPHKRVHDDELILEMAGTLEEMQERVMMLLDQVINEDLISM